MVRRRSLHGLALLTGALLLVACNGGDRSSRSTRASTTSRAAGGTSSVGVNPTKPADAVVPRASVTPRTSTTSRPGTGAARDGDVDGDGRADTLTIPEPGVLHASYSGGGEDSVPFQGGNPAFVEIRVLGASDADRDGHAEVFVQVDQGASMSTATVFRYVDRHLRLVTAANGAQAALASGGSTGFVATWACRPATTSTAAGAALTVAAGPSTAPGAYRLDVSYYRFDQARLALISQESVGPAALDSVATPRDGVSGAPGCGQVRLTP